LACFYFLPTVQTIGPGPCLIPAAGLTHLQARHATSLIFYSFAVLDIKDSFTECPFPASLLSSQLLSWLKLLHKLAILLLWDKFPWTMSYQWILSCWSLSNVFKDWLEAVRWQLACGFATIQDLLMLKKYQIITNGNTVAATAAYSSTILTKLSA
jgi:hypothetical protein